MDQTRGLNNTLYSINEAYFLNEQKKRYPLCPYLENDEITYAACLQDAFRGAANDERKDK